jgi:two-component SAPR family response regulator
VYYKGLLKFDTNNSRVLGVIGAICQYKGNFPEAVEYNKKALAADPANDAVYGNMIALYAALKDTANMNFYLRERARHRR